MRRDRRVSVLTATASVVPGYVPLALLVALEGSAALVAVLVARTRRAAPDAPALCSRCGRLHRRTEALGRTADAVAIGALAFLAALPFVAAGFEGGFTVGRLALAAATVAAVLAVAGEADLLARAIAARLWPRFVWRAEPTRIVGGGARWLGVPFALFLFQPGSGTVLRFGTVGARLASDLGSTWTIVAAAALLVLATIAALASRWLAPIVFGSLPATLAAAREPHGRRA